MDLVKIIRHEMRQLEKSSYAAGAAFTMSHRSKRNFGELQIVQNG